MKLFVLTRDIGYNAYEIVEIFTNENDANEAKSDCETETENWEYNIETFDTKKSELDYEEVINYKCGDGFLCTTEQQAINHCKEQKDMDNFRNSSVSNYMTYDEFIGILQIEGEASYINDLAKEFL